MAIRVELDHREYHKKLTMLIESLVVNAAVVVWSSMKIQENGIRKLLCLRLKNTKTLGALVGFEARASRVWDLQPLQKLIADSSRDQFLTSNKNISSSPWRLHLVPSAKMREPS